MSKTCRVVALAALAFRSGDAQDWDYKNIDDWKVYNPLCQGLPSDLEDHNDWQSPINIISGDAAPISTFPELIVKNGGCKDFKSMFNGHAWQTDFCSAIPPTAATAPACQNLQAKWKGETYTMAQLHFHSAGENTLDDKTFDGELHMVHMTADGKKVLVIGVWLQSVDVATTQSSSFLRDLFTYGYIQADTAAQAMHTTGDDTLNPYAGLLTSGGGFFSYTGSFTTPPCTPSVEWISVQDPVPVGSDLMRDLQAFFKSPSCTQCSAKGTNNRPTQPMAGRKIVLGSFDIIPAAPPSANYQALSTSTFCFPGDSSVKVAGQGTASLKNVQVGDRVLVEDAATGNLVYEPVLSLLHVASPSESSSALLTRVGVQSL